MGGNTYYIIDIERAIGYFHYNKNPNYCKLGFCKEKDRTPCLMHNKVHLNYITKEPLINRVALFDLGAA